MTANLIIIKTTNPVIKKYNQLVIKNSIIMKMTGNNYNARNTSFYKYITFTLTII